MAHDSRVTVDSSTWGSWKADATDTADVATLGGNWSFGLVAATSAAVGLLMLPADWRYSALIYAPVLGLGARAIAARLVTASRFRDGAGSMRAALVPKLVEKIPDSKLHELALKGRTTFGSLLVFAMETRRSVDLVAKDVPHGFDGDDLEWYPPGDVGW